MQYSKVEISGVNTNDLIVLSEEEKLSLLERTRQGDKKARDELIRGNLRLVLSVLQKFTGRSESADDLFQVGVVGLIKAIDNFDPKFEVKFSSYAHPMIAGEVRRYLRDFQPVRVSRSLRDLAYRSMLAKEKLTEKLMREPTATEIAEETGEKRCDIVTAMESVSEPVSLYEPVYSEAGDTLYVVDQLKDCCDDKTWLDELSVKQTIASLQPREKKILYLRFFKGKTQMEVARQIGISQAQVSRLEKSALERIKEQF